MCTDIKKAVLGDFRAKIGGIFEVAVAQQQTERKKGKLSIADGLPQN